MPNRPSSVKLAQVHHPHLAAVGQALQAELTGIVAKLPGQKEPGLFRRNARLRGSLVGQTFIVDNSASGYEGLSSVNSKEVSDFQPFHAIYYRHTTLASRIRVFIDSLAARWRGPGW